MSVPYLSGDSSIPFCFLCKVPDGCYRGLIPKFKGFVLLPSLTGQIPW